MHLLWELLNSSFSTAFFGAVAGSLTIILINWNTQQRRTLADINSSIGVLTGLINTFLNIKRQHVVPVLHEYEQNLAKRELQKSGQYPGRAVVFKTTFNRFDCPKLDFDLPLDRIFTLTDRQPKIVEALMQAKRSTSEVESAFRIWNDLVVLSKRVPEDERVAFYFGERSKSGVADTIFRDGVQNLKTTVDDAIFFSVRAIRDLKKAGMETLPCWLRKKVISFEIVDEEHRALMPPEDYKSGW